MANKQTFMSKSTDLGCNKSPLNQGRTDRGFENIKIKMIYYPTDEAMLRQYLAKCVISTTGHDPDQDLPPELAEELFRGGLQTGMETPWISFEVSGISRQLTHELVRTRKAVFHQQSMRWTDFENFNARMPQTIADSEASVSMRGFPLLGKLLGLTNMGSAKPNEIYDMAMNVAREAYAALKEADLPYQDCRNVCPIGTETYIVCSYSIAEFIGLYSYRGCTMFLPEMVHVVKEMRAQLIAKFPWMEPFVKVSCEKVKRCTFQGFEDTAQCDLPWATDRVYKPNYDLIGLRGKAYGNEAK